MAKTQESAVQEPAIPETVTSKTELFTIEELRVKKKTSGPIYSGVCTAQSWRPGKIISEADYDAAVKSFSTAPMGKKVN